MTKLTPKQARFVAEYLIDLNASAAYSRAGYAAKGNSAEVNASRLLRNAQVASAVDAASTERQRRTHLSADRVLLEVSRIAFFDPRKLLNADGTPKPIQELDDDTAGAIAGLEVMEVWEGSGADRAIKGVVKKYRVSDKNAALANAMRHHGLLGDRLAAGQGSAGTTKPASLTERGQALLDAAAAGALTIPQAAQLLTGLGTLAKLVETDELARRIADLEAKHGSKS